MKKIVLIAAGALAPLSFAMAGDAKNGEAAAQPVQATGPTFPDWDKREAGQTLDLSAGSAAAAEEK